MGEERLCPGCAAACPRCGCNAAKSDLEEGGGLCPDCREPYKPTTAELEEAGFPEFVWDEVKELFRPVGCAACSKTGFRGRVGMYEVMPMTEEIERMVVEMASSEEIRRSARRDGMTTLREDGLEKVRLGVTSVEEVLRVVA